MSGQFFTFAGLQYLFENALTPVQLTEFTAVSTNGSALLSGVSSYTGLEVGQLIDGPTIPPGTYIVDLDGNSGTITLSQPATATTPSSSSSVFVAGGNYTQNLPLSIHLLTGPVVATPNVQMSQLTEANYDGYTPQQPVGPPVYNTPPPRAFFVAQYERLTFAPADYIVQNAITGHCWTYTPPGATSPIVVALESYGAPAPLFQPGDVHTFNPVLSIGFDETAGVSSPGVP